MARVYLATDERFPVTVATCSNFGRARSMSEESTVGLRKVGIGADHDDASYKSINFERTLRVAAAGEGFRDAPNAREAAEGAQSVYFATVGSVTSRGKPPIEPQDCEVRRVRLPGPGSRCWPVCTRDRCSSDKW